MLFHFPFWSPKMWAKKGYLIAAEYFMVVEFLELHSGGGVSGSLLNISEVLSPASGFQVAGPLPQLSSLPPVVRL